MSLVSCGKVSDREINKSIIDIKHKYDLTHIFSDAYDLVQGCALYLCKHFGKHLSDIIGYTKKK